MDGYDIAGVKLYYIPRAESHHEQTLDYRRRILSW